MKVKEKPLAWWEWVLTAVLVVGVGWMIGGLLIGSDWGMGGPNQTAPEKGQP